MASILNYRDNILQGKILRVKTTEVYIIGKSSFIKDNNNNISPEYITLDLNTIGFSDTNTPPPVYTWYCRPSSTSVYQSLNISNPTALISPRVLRISKELFLENIDVDGGHLDIKVNVSQVGRLPSEDVHTILYSVGGANGVRTATLELFKWTNTIPTTFPVGTSTYTWALGTFTLPTVLNGWSLLSNAPVNGTTLYSISTIYADSLNHLTSEVTWPTSPIPYIVGLAAEDTYVGQLDNDSHTLPVYSTGLPNYTGCTTTMRVNVGTINDTTNGWTFNSEGSIGVSFTASSLGNTITVVQVTQTVSTVTITATKVGYAPISRVFSITLGEKGGTTANLTNDAHTVSVTNTGTIEYAGCTTTMLIYVSGIDDSANWTYSVVKSAGVVCNETTTSRVQTVTFINTNVSTVTITASKANFSNITKVFTITKSIQGSNGANTYVGQLDNDSHTLPMYSTGLPNYTGCTTTMRVNVGMLNDTNSWTFNSEGSIGVSFTASSLGNTITVVGVTQALSTVTITASKVGYTSVSSIFSITKGVVGGTTANLTNDAHTVSVTNTGTIDYAGCTTTMLIYVSGIDDSANWTYSVVKSTGVVCNETTTSRVQTVTFINTNVSTVTITASKANFSNITKVFTITKSIQGSNGTPGTPGTTGTAGTPGTNGTPGNKTAIISAFKWSNSGIGSYSQAFTYTWSNGAVSAYPTGWSSNSITNTTPGYTLYQITLNITGVYDAVSSVLNWSAATTNSIGYVVNGTIGPQGASYRTAYIVTTSSTAPLTPTPVIGDAAPTGWSFTATSNLSAGQYMYQSDGIYTTNIAWGAPYLSNLKVGSLSAIVANLGTVTISTLGSLSGGKTSGSDTSNAGFFLGYDSSTYKLKIGNAGDTKSLTWDGSNLTLKGDLTGSSNINITGSGKFDGNTSATTVFGAYTTAASFNSSLGASIAIHAKSSGLAGIVVEGTATYGVLAKGGLYGMGGFASDTTNGGIGVYGIASNTGVESTGVQASTGAAAGANVSALKITANGISAAINFSVYTLGTPANSAAPSGFIKIMVGGIISYLPYYR